MALIQPKTLQEWLQKQLDDWQTLKPNVNMESDGMVNMDAMVIAERLFELQQDAITLVNNAFIAYSTGDELSNLGLDRGIPRKIALASSGEVTFGRAVVAAANFLIPEGNLISTQPDGDGRTINFRTLEETYIYGTVPTPGIIISTLQTAGGAIVNGTYHYKITAVSGDGKETDVSPLETVVVSNGFVTNSIDLAWTSVPRAVAYRIYIEVGGIGNSVVLLTETINAFFTDVIGNSTSSITPPLTNETGSTEITVDVECTDEGVIGNVGAQTVTKFINKPSGVEYVFNLDSITGGVDTETDIDYRARIRRLLTTNTGKVTKTGYKNTIEAVDGVEIATPTRPFPGLNNIIWIYITANTTTGLPSQDIIDAAQAEVSELASGDDGRAVCDDVTVKAPISYVINLDITITELAEGFDATACEDEINSLMISFFRSIGVAGYMRNVDIENVIHDSNSVEDFSLDSPTANIQLDYNELAILGTINYTYNL